MPSIPPAALRLATPADLPGILPLFRAYQEHYAMLTSASEAKTRDFLAHLLAHREAGFIVVAEAESAIVGLAAAYFTISGVLAERLVHLGDLYVAPTHRRRGLATALVREVAREARAHGIPLVRWLSLATNTDLNAWYTSLGATTGDFKLFLLPTQVSEGRQ